MLYPIPAGRQWGCSPLLNLRPGSAVPGAGSAGSMCSVKLTLRCQRSSTTQAEFGRINLDWFQDSWQKNFV